VKEKDTDNLKGNCVKFMKSESGVETKMVLITKPMLMSWSTVIKSKREVHFTIERKYKRKNN
jgi:hypothetical protein